MKKIIIALLAFVVSSTAFAQDKTEQASDIISVSFGSGAGTWSISDKNFNFENKKTNDSNGFDVAYQHVWRKGWGVGANVARYAYDVNGNGKNKINLTYVGPAAVYNYTTSKAWRWHGMLGLGYAHQNDPDLNKSGFGACFNVGVDYKISAHFGVGLVLQDYATVFSFKDLDVDATFANSHLAVALSYNF